jgi:hypothetical protein
MNEELERATTKLAELELWIEARNSMEYKTIIKHCAKAVAKAMEDKVKNGELCECLDQINVLHERYLIEKDREIYEGRMS